MHDARALAMHERKLSSNRFKAGLDHYEAWTESGSDLADAKRYKICVHSPLLRPPHESDLIVDLIPPPELHLFLGTFNHLFHEMKKIWPNAEQWPQKLGIRVSGYHGGQFSGGDCMKLMKNVDCLAQMCPLFVLPFVSAFRSFQKVVLSCFSTNLSASFRADIEAFRKDYTSLRISITPKVHIIF